jgi:hypothetical protein
MFAQHMLATIKADGKMAKIMPHGFSSAAVKKGRLGGISSNADIQKFTCRTCAPFLSSSGRTIKRVSDADDSNANKLKHPSCQFYDPDECDIVHGP